MKYAGEEIFKDFTLNGYWWIPPDQNGVAYRTLSYSLDRMQAEGDAGIWE
jgi:hypothetical protein